MLSLLAVIIQPVYAACGDGSVTVDVTVPLHYELDTVTSTNGIYLFFYMLFYVLHTFLI